MSEPPKDQTTPTAAAAKLDPASASAALALAVTSAEKECAQQPKADAGEASSGARTAQDLLKLGQPLLHKARAIGGSVTRRHLAQAAAVALAVALGWAGGSQTLSGARQAHAEAAGTGLRQSQEDLARLTGDVQALRQAVESLKGNVEPGKSAASSRPFLDRLEALERDGQDTAAKIARVAAASERIERAGAAAEAKLAAISARLDAGERHSAAPKPAEGAGVDPAPTGSVPDAPGAKPAYLAGWVLREVYDGAALVESRSGRLHEVAPGRTLPGVGRVKGIERRGKIWVVVTAKGVIGPPARWR
jgi:hypothetical protein